ncbi:MAG TPA: glycosyltransferase [Novosphingobium sp.]|nr:glycosyltransferase [Novosphingobium sp.]
MTPSASPQRVSAPAGKVFSPKIRTFSLGPASPAVSVVMTTWNDLRFIRDAVGGVLRQTFTDFEFIIVDDGSDYPHEVEALAALDPRIRIVRLDANLGAAEAGNRGIALARAPIVARMDYDDIAEPGWLAAVTQALAEDPELGIVGTWATLISEHGDPLGIDRTPQSDFAIRLTLLSHNPFYHSSVAYRRELIALVGGIEGGQNLTHDHRLWRALLPHCRARNLPQPLVRYRYNPRGITGSSDPLTSRSRSHDIRVGLWNELGLAYPLDSRPLGDAFDSFLRDRPAPHPELWGAVAEVIESAIGGLAAQEGQFLRPGDEPLRDAFVLSLRARLAAGPKRPPSRVQRLRTALRLRGFRRTVAAIVRKSRNAMGAR